MRPGLFGSNFLRGPAEPFAPGAIFLAHLARFEEIAALQTDVLAAQKCLLPDDSISVQGSAGNFQESAAEIG
jgi:hypothetical protein